MKENRELIKKGAYSENTVVCHGRFSFSLRRNERHCKDLCSCTQNYLHSALNSPAPAFPKLPNTTQASSRLVLQFFASMNNT